MRDGGGLVRVFICDWPYMIPQDVADYLSGMADEVARLRAEIDCLTRASTVTPAPVELAANNDDAGAAAGEPNR